MKKMAFTVFVSYSRQDEKLINSLYSTLKQNGINVKIFETNYVPDLENKPLSKTIREFISESDCMLLFLSKDLVKSSNVAWEIGVARNLSKAIILIVEPGTEIPSDLVGTPHIVFDRNNPGLTLEEIRQVSVRLKSEKEKGNPILGILFLLAALGFIALLASDGD